jgi:hypothetical protein
MYEFSVVPNGLNSKSNLMKIRPAILSLLNKDEHHERLRRRLRMRRS